MRRDVPGPYSLDALAALPVPALFSVDAASWKTRLIAWFEGETGRTLYPMQVEMLMIETLAYALSVLGEEGQMVAEQHLVALAGAAGLERLAVNRSTPRLPAAKARTTLRFTLAQARATRLQIPAGTRVRAEEDGPIFLSLAAAVIPAGSLSVNAVAEAEDAGTEANGLLPGQIATLMDPIAGATVTNLTASSGGADIEDVDAWRLRVANAFERISTGGSAAWYTEETFKVSSAIIDVAVVRPQPCYVDIYALTAAGPASTELRALILAHFNTAQALDIRFGDDVSAKAADAVAVEPVLTVRHRGADVAAVTAAAEAVLDRWRLRLAAEVVPGDVEGAARAVSGVVDAQITGLAYQQLSATQYLGASLTVTMVAL